MDNTRVYSEKVKIDEKSVAAFYDRLAGGEKGTVGVRTVLLGNQDAEAMNEKIRYDRDIIVPMLGANSGTRILDLGCGIARWAEYLMPCGAFYCGADVSEKMIRAARTNCSRLGTNFRLHNMSILDAVGQSPEFWGGRFDLVIARGVFMYLNDDTLASVLRQLPGLLAERCTLHFADPVGIGTRLTLNRYASEALASNYSAIYRTVEEYLEFFAPLQRAGFSIVKSERQPSPGETYTDTCRHGFILRR